MKIGASQGSLVNQSSKPSIKEVSKGGRKIKALGKVKIMLKMLKHIASGKSLSSRTVSSIPDRPKENKMSVESNALQSHEIQGELDQINLGCKQFNDKLKMVLDSPPTLHDLVARKDALINIENSFEREVVNNISPKMNDQFYLANVNDIFNEYDIPENVVDARDNMSDFSVRIKKEVGNISRAEKKGSVALKKMSDFNSEKSKLTTSVYIMDKKNIKETISSIKRDIKNQSSAIKTGEKAIVKIKEMEKKYKVDVSESNPPLNREVDSLKEKLKTMKKHLKEAKEYKPDEGGNKNSISMKKKVEKLKKNGRIAEEIKGISDDLKSDIKKILRERKNNVPTAIEKKKISRNDTIKLTPKMAPPGYLDKLISFPGENVHEIKESFKKIRNESDFKRGLLTIKEAKLSVSDKAELRRFLSVVMIKSVRNPKIMEQLNRDIVEYVLHPDHQGRMRQEYNKTVQLLADKIDEGYKKSIG